MTFLREEIKRGFLRIPWTKFLTTQREKREFVEGQIISVWKGEAEKKRVRIQVS